MSKKALSQRQLNRLARLAALPDDRIDVSDIPEIPAKKLSLAQSGTLYRPLKQPVTIRLDADVVRWFKEHAKTGKYQSEINRVLRRHVVETEKRSA